MLFTNTSKCLSHNAMITYVDARLMETVAAGEGPDIGGARLHVLHADAALALPGLLLLTAVQPHQLLHTLEDLLWTEAGQCAIV